MKRNTIKNSLALSLIAQATFLATSGFAQEQFLGEDVYLEELIVTAQKRDESVQDIPITISAYSAEDLDALGVHETSDLGKAVPGMEVSTSSGEGSQLIIFMRGAGLNDFNTNNAGPIGIYSDEVYVSSPVLSPFQLFDAERVEVLKGPQGTIYGRNTTGGAIKFITKKPTRETKASGKWRIGNFNTNALEASISGALSDTVAARVAVAKTDSKGHGTNLVTGGDVNKTDTTAYRALLSYEPNDKLSILLNAHGAKASSQSTSLSPLGTLDPKTGEVCNIDDIKANRCVDINGYRAPDDPFKGNYKNIGEIDLDSKGAYAQVDYDFDNGTTFTSVTALDTVDRTLPTDPDGTEAEILAIDYGVSSDTFSQELRFTGSTDYIDWLAGAFFLTEEINQNQTIDFFRELRPLIGGGIDPIGEKTGGAPVFFARGINTQDLESTAFFGQANIAINDATTITLGARYTDETRKFSSIAQLEEPEVFGPQPAIQYSISDLKTSSDAVSYRLAVDHKLNDATLMYASASRGFKSGGFNGGFLSLNEDSARRQLEAYDPEFVNAYELGIKSDLFNYRVRINASLFFNDFEDLQVFTLVNSDALPVQVLDNASNAEAKGLEIDATALLTDSLTVSLNGVFMDTELKDFPVAANGKNFSGNKIAQSPDTSLSGLVRYHYDLNSGGTITAQGSFSYKDDLFFSTDNNPLVAQDAYTLLNTRISYTGFSENWTLSAFINNLTDKAYTTDVTDLTDIAASYVRTFGLPRTYGVELTVDF